jgi:hypothetical protein
MSKILIGLCTLLLFATFTPATARADTIVVTSGSLTVPGFFQGPNYSFAGQNFSATAGSGDPGFTAPSSCFPCGGGNLNVNSFFAGTSLGQGTVTINGTTFNDLFIAGTFQFIAGSVMIPPPVAAITVTVPFTFSGVMNGCTVSHALCTASNIVFTTQVSGSGLAFVELNFFQSGTFSFYQFKNVTYVFTDPVPEPMSLLLLGGGLAALAGARLKRRMKR